MYDPFQHKKTIVTHPQSQLHVSMNIGVTCKALRGSRVHSGLFKQICAGSAGYVIRPIRRGVEAGASPSAHLKKSKPFREHLLQLTCALAMYGVMEQRKKRSEISAEFDHMYSTELLVKWLSDE